MTSVPLSLPALMTSASQQQQQHFQQLHPNLAMGGGAAPGSGGCCAGPDPSAAQGVTPKAARKTVKVRRHTSAARIPKPHSPEIEQLITSVGGEGRPAPGEIGA